MRKEKINGGYVPPKPAKPLTNEKTEPPKPKPPKDKD